MPRSGIGSARYEEGPVASIPVAAANQTAQLSTEAQLPVQPQSATTKLAQSNPVQDTVTLSNGVPQPTPAEEAGLFQVAAPALSTFSAASFGGANAGAAPKANDATVAALNAPPATPAAPKTATVQNAAAVQATSNTFDAAGGNAGAAPAANTTAANNVNAIVAGAGTPTAINAAPAANAAQTANAPSTNAAQSAPAASSQSQNQILQFTEYLQQLGLSPQAQSQMIDAARLLNDLDPPAFQQAIVALRAEAASLAAQAGSAPTAQVATPAADAAATQGGGTASTAAAAPAASKASSGTTQ